MVEALADGDVERGLVAEGAIGIDGLVDTGGEEAGFEAGGAQDGVAGEGNALQGGEFLEVDWVVDGDEVGFDVGDFVEVLGADDDEIGGGEAMFPGVLGRAGFALGKAWCRRGISKLLGTRSESAPEMIRLA
ncbi:MAG TPA: hypothetical protein VME43_09595 [Bryobacteraceae bacterium]|nr:hypothetical protein [Bryobacteraceae bacterium]